MITRWLRDPDRPADAAAARRLPRDRDARLRRDPAADRAERRQPRSASTSRTGRTGSRRSTRPASATASRSLTGGFLPSNYLTCCHATLLGHQIQYSRPLLLDGARAARRSPSSARCACATRGSAAPGSRSARTRRRPAAMGIPLMRTKTWAYASGAFFGGVAGAYYAVVKSGTFPDDFYFNISVFILCMVILGGMGNVWGVMAGAAFLAYLEPVRARQHRLLAQHAHPSSFGQPPEPRRAALRVRDLRRDHRRRDALPARRPASVQAPRSRAARERVARRAALRRPARGRADEPTTPTRTSSSPRRCARSSAAWSPSTTSTSPSRAARSSR